MKIYLSALFLLLVNLSFCQVEFKALQSYSKETLAEYKGVLPLGEKGAVMFGRADLTENGNDHYTFIFYDADLKVEKETIVPINKKFRIRSTCKRGDDVFVLFTNKDEYSFLHITPSFSITKMDGTFPDKKGLETCYVMNSTAYFTDKNGLVMLDLNTEQISITHYKAESFGVKSLLLTHFQTFPERNECMAFFTSPPSKMPYIAVRLNSAGEVLSNLNVTEALGYNAAPISAASAEGNDYAYSGAYATNGNSLPEGLFFISIKDEKVTAVKTYNFLDLEPINRTFYKIGNYNSSMVERRYDRQISAKEAQKAYAYPMRSATHDLIKIDNNYLLVKELFEVKYIHNVVKQTYRKAGLVQFASLTVLLDSDGELIWNNNFSIPGDFFTGNEKLMARINISNDQINFAKAHPAGASFTTLFIKDGKITEKSSDKKSLESETLERFTNMYFTGYPGGIDFWHDNSWLAYGQEKLRKKDKELPVWENYIIHKLNYAPKK